MFAAISFPSTKEPEDGYRGITFNKTVDSTTYCFLACQGDDENMSNQKKLFAIQI